VLGPSIGPSDVRLRRTKTIVEAGEDGRPKGVISLIGTVVEIRHRLGASNITLAYVMNENTRVTDAIVSLFAVGPTQSQTFRNQSCAVTCGSGRLKVHRALDSIHIKAGALAFFFVAAANVGRLAGIDCHTHVCDKSSIDDFFAMISTLFLALATLIEDNCIICHVIHAGLAVTVPGISRGSTLAARGHIVLSPGGDSGRKEQQQDYREI